MCPPRRPSKGPRARPEMVRELGHMQPTHPREGQRPSVGGIRPKPALSDKDDSAGDADQHLRRGRLHQQRPPCAPRCQRVVQLNVLVLLCGHCSSCLLQDQPLLLLQAVQQFMVRMLDVAPSGGPGKPLSARRLLPVLAVVCRWYSYVAVCPGSPCVAISSDLAPARRLDTSVLCHV